MCVGDRLLLQTDGPFTVRRQAICRTFMNVQRLSHVVRTVSHVTNSFNTAYPFLLET